MAADILALRHRRGAGRRRPAPARRAHPRHRDPVQPPLRRHVRGARGDDPAGRRARSWTSRSRPAKMSKSATRRRARCTCSTRPKVHREEDQVGGHRLRHRGAPRPATRSPASRTCSRSSPRSPAATIADVDAEFATASTARSRRRGRRRGRRVPPPDPGALRGARRRSRRGRPRSCAEGASKAQAIAAPVLDRVAAPPVGLLGADRATDSVLSRRREASSASRRSDAAGRGRATVVPATGLGLMVRARPARRLPRARPARRMRSAPSSGWRR